MVHASRTEQPGPLTQVSRRTFLRSLAVGTTLLAVPTYLTSLGQSAYASGPSKQAGGPRFYVYGTVRPSDDPNPVLSLRTDGNGSQDLTALAAELAGPPVSSPDGTLVVYTTIAAVGSQQSLAVHLVERATGQTVGTATYLIPGSTPKSLVLVSAVFTPDSQTFCIVTSLMRPDGSQFITKANPLTGGTDTVESVMWHNSHSLAFVDCHSANVSGPFDLEDAPSLPRVRLIATDSDLFLWSVAELTGLYRQGRSVTDVLPTLTAFSIGSGKPRFSQPIYGPWPVNEEPVSISGDGDLLRLVHSRQLEIYSPSDGAMTSQALSLPPMAARGSGAALVPLPDQRFLICDPSVGVAQTLASGEGFPVLSEYTFEPARYYTSDAHQQISVSADGSTLYVLGGRSRGGVLALDAASGTTKAIFQGDSHFQGIKAVSDGTVVAWGPAQPRLTVLSNALDLQDTLSTDVAVTAII